MGARGVRAGRRILTTLVATAIAGVGMATATQPAHASDLTWTLQTSPNDSSWQDVTYGNGLFVAVASAGTGDRVMTSPDGVNWTAATASVANVVWISVAYGAGTFVAVSRSGDVMRSSDGITWTSGGSTGFDTRAVSFGNNMFVAVGLQSPRIKTSPDGTTWTTASWAGTQPLNQWYAGAFGNNMFVAAGAPRGAVADSAYSDAAGGQWNPSNHVYGTAGVPLHQWNDITYAAGTFVAVGQRAVGYRAMTSTNGADWTDQVTPVDNAWEGVAYGGGQFVAVADNGTADRVMTSPDGVNWTLQASADVNAAWQSITYAGGIFVAVGRSGAIMTSGSASGSGSSSTASTSDAGVPNVLQQYPISSEDAVSSPADACRLNAPEYVVDGRMNDERRFESWSLSYAQWPNAGAGGYVCTRTLSYQPGTDIWLTSDSELSGSGRLQQYAIEPTAIARITRERGMADAEARSVYCRSNAPVSADLGDDWGQRNEGWSPSYAAWLNEGRGGWVCSRSL